MPTWLRRLILFGVPAITGLVNLFHPVFSDPPVAGLRGRVDWFITLHAINLVLFSLLGLSAILLVSRQRGIAAVVSLLAVVVYVPFYAGFDAIVGLGTGSLVRYAYGVDPSQLPVLEPAINVIWTGPVSSMLGQVGSIAWVVAMLAAAVAFTPPGRRLLVTAIALIGFGVFGWVASGGLDFNSPLWWLALVVPAAVVFVAARLQLVPALLTLAGMLFGTTHVPPAGSLAMAAFLAAALWVELRPAAVAAAQTTTLAAPAAS
jgi:hypothetical protein